MKLLFCKNCGDYVAPSRDPKIMRICECGRAGCFWESPNTGHLVIYSAHHSACAVGIHNGLLMEYSKENLMNADMVKKVLDETPDNYLFKDYNSCIVYFEPDMTGDVRWITPDEFNIKIKQRYLNDPYA